VAAAAGAHVAKHGNRSVSSKSGSADALETAGINLMLSSDQVEQCVREVGVGFMFAPGHHSAMKHAIGPRKEMAARTVFNVLGPLTNPAGVPNLVLGVFSDELLEPLANVLKELGANHVMVVHSRDGLDEISIGDVTDVAELKDGEITRYTIEPEAFDLQRVATDHIKADGPDQSVAMIRGLLGGEAGPARDIVALNAGAAIYVSGLAGSLADGVKKAQQVLDSGDGLARLEKLAALSQSFKADA
jgi:anthranilate phosphoribosyltransferase